MTVPHLATSLHLVFYSINMFKCHYTYLDVILTVTFHLRSEYLQIYKESCFAYISSKLLKRVKSQLVVARAERVVTGRSSAAMNARMTVS